MFTWIDKVIIYILSIFNISSPIYTKTFSNFCGHVYCSTTSFTLLLGANIYSMCQFQTGTPQKKNKYKIAKLRTDKKSAHKSKAVVNGHVIKDNSPLDGAHTVHNGVHHVSNGGLGVNGNDHSYNGHYSNNNEQEEQEDDHFDEYFPRPTGLLRIPKSMKV